MISKQQYTYICKNTGENRRTSLFRYKRFINFWRRFVDTRRETQFLKVFRNYTMLTTHQPSTHLVVQSQFLNIMVGPHLLNIMVGPNFSPSWSDPNFNCLPFRQTTQLSAYMAQCKLPTDCSDPNFSTPWSDPNFSTP